MINKSKDLPSAWYSIGNRIVGNTAMHHRYLANSLGQFQGPKFFQNAWAPKLSASSNEWCNTLLQNRGDKGGGVSRPQMTGNEISLSAQHFGRGGGFHSGALQSAKIRHLGTKPRCSLEMAILSHLCVEVHK